MTYLQYDEPANVERLGRLPNRLRVAFALLAGIRLLPMYTLFHRRTGRGDPRALRALVERLWRDVSGEPMDDGEVKAAVERAMELIPSEDDCWDQETQPYAEDAAAAIAYALRARMTDDPQEAAWAARRVYEAADQFATASGELATRGVQSERAVLTQPVVQAELRRQARDLDELSQLPGGYDDISRLSQMRQRSEFEAASFFPRGE